MTPPGTPPQHPVRPSLGGDLLGRFTLLVLGVVTALSVVRAFQPMTYAGDIWRQSDTATIAHNFLINGMQLFYPQINWGGAGPGYVEAEFQLMPWLTAVLYQVFGEHAWLGRLVSLVFMLVAAAAFWGLARRLLSPRAARWALIAFAVSPAFMRYGTAFMPEATVLAFYLLALLAFYRWLDEDRGVWLAAAAAAMSMAGLVKPTSLHIGLVLLIWLLIAARDRLRRPSLYVAGVLALVAPALWLWHAHELYVTYGNTFGVISGGDDKFGNMADWLSAQFYLGNLRSETIFIYGFVGLPFALLGAWRAWKSRRPVILVAGFAALVVYYFAVARYSESDAGIQYHIYSLPYAAVLVGLGLDSAAGWLRTRLAGKATLGRVSAIAAVVAVLALFAQSVNVFVDSVGDRGGKFEPCATALDKFSQPGDLVVVSTDSTTRMDGVANNWQEPVIFYMADRRGWSLAADQHTPAFLAADQKAGAKFFVVYDNDLVPAGGALDQWLGTHSTRLPAAATGGCSVWSLTPPAAA